MLSRLGEHNFSALAHRKTGNASANGNMEPKKAFWWNLMISPLEN